MLTPIPGSTPTSHLSTWNQVPLISSTTGLGTDQHAALARRGLAQQMPSDHSRLKLRLLFCFVFGMCT